MKPVCFRQRSRVLHFATAHRILQSNITISGKGGKILQNCPHRATHARLKNGTYFVHFQKHSIHRTCPVAYSAPYSCLSLLQRSRPTVLTTHTLLFCGNLLFLPRVSTCSYVVSRLRTAGAVS